MKIGQRIKIKREAKYPGQDMSWTEEKTGDVILPVGSIWYHKSSGEVRSFFPKVTCFFPEKMSFGSYYALKVTSVVQAEEYGREVRIDLEKYANAVEIFYVGDIDFVYTDKVVSDRRGGYMPEIKYVDKTIEIS